MEKYHTIVKIERVRKELQLGNFSQAFAFATKINSEKLTSIADFSLLAEAFFHAKEYKKANEYYLLVYNRTKSKRALSQLVHVSIKLNDIEAANDYLSKYEKCASGDFNKYIYRYYLNQLEGKTLQESANLLEKLKEIEYIDHWVYELAKIYHKMGQKAKCIKECDDLILWFGQGKYVQRAKALKAYYTGALDVTLAGQDAEMFAKEMQRILGSEVKKKNFEKEAKIKNKQTTEEELTTKVNEQITESYLTADMNEQITESSLTTEIYEQTRKEDYQITNESDSVDSDDLVAKENNLITDEISLQVKENGVGVDDNPSDDYFYHDITKNLVASIAELSSSIADNFESTEDRDSISKDIENNISNKSSKSRKKHKKKDGSKSSMLKITEEEGFISQLLEEEEREHKERMAKEKNEQNIELLNQTSEQSVLDIKPKEDFLSMKTKDINYREIKEKKYNANSEVKKERMEESIIKIRSIQDKDLKIDKKTQLWNVTNNKGIILTDIMGTFLQIESIQKQFLDCLENICKESLTKADFILTAEKESFSHLLMFAKSLAKVLHKMGAVKSGKIALIRAEKLNQIDFVKKKEITDSCLIIESAGNLEEKTITNLLQVCKNNQGSMAVILMDMNSNITNILNNKELCKTFQHQIYLPNYSILEWKSFIYEIIKENEYEIHKQADILFEEKIEEILRKEDVIIWDEMIALAQQVIQNAEKRNAKLLHKLSTNQFHSTQLMVIIDSDFKF